MIFVCVEGIPSSTDPIVLSQQSSVYQAIPQKLCFTACFLHVTVHNEVTHLQDEAWRTPVVAQSVAFQGLIGMPFIRKTAEHSICLCQSWRSASPIYVEDSVLGISQVAFHLLLFLTVPSYRSTSCRNTNHQKRLAWLSQNQDNRTSGVPISVKSSAICHVEHSRRRMPWMICTA